MHDQIANFFSRHIDHQHEAMFAYYTAARWFGITLDLVLGMFCVLVGLFELYTVKDSSTAGMNAYHLLSITDGNLVFLKLGDIVENLMCCHN